MIKLFITDLDGCLTEPFQKPDLSVIETISRLCKLSKNDISIPDFTLCTGRPLPYAEAIAQVVGIKNWLIFENGAGLYHTLNNELIWSDLLNQNVFEQLKIMRDWVTNEILPIYPGMITEFAKRADVGVVSPHTNDILTVFEKAKEKTQKDAPLLEVNCTDVSVNIISKDCNKGTGLRLLSDKISVQVEEMAFIGDSMNDLTAMDVAGLTFAPSNAKKDIKQKAGYVLEKRSTEAVLEAYQTCIELNKNEIAKNKD